jgi:hypothetical protein
MKEYMFCFEQPRILGLTAPLLNSTCDPGRLEGELRRLEMVLHSAAETASDIVSVLRLVRFVIQLLHSPGRNDVIHKLNATCYIYLYHICIMLPHQFFFLIHGCNLFGTST